MNDKKTRYINTIITFDKTREETGITSWREDSFPEFLMEQEKHYGLKILSKKEEIFVKVEYNNIIWEYKIYYGSYKNKNKTPLISEEKWKKIERQLGIDLKMIGLKELKDVILNSLKKGEYFEYTTQIEKQFKKYCV